jgi:hypothetical protein
VVFRTGLWVLGGINKSGVIPDGVSRVPDPMPQSPLGVPALRYRFGGDDRVGWTKISTQAVFAAGCASLKTYFVSTREDAIPFCFKKA